MKRESDNPPPIPPSRHIPGVTTLPLNCVPTLRVGFYSDDMPADELLSVLDEVFPNTPKSWDRIKRCIKRVQQLSESHYDPPLLYCAAFPADENGVVIGYRVLGDDEGDDQDDKPDPTPTPPGKSGA